MALSDHSDVRAARRIRLRFAVALAGSIRREIAQLLKAYPGLGTMFATEIADFIAHPKSRRRKAEFQHKMLAVAFEHTRANGYRKVDSALAHVAKRYGVSESTIQTARRTYGRLIPRR